MPSGRLKIYNADELAIKLNDYIDNSSDPIIEEFCLINNMSRDTLHRHSQESVVLSDTIKKCHAKQAIRTQRLAESGDINTTFAIFKLKQKCYGWSDKQEIESINVNVDLSEDEADEILKRFGKNTDS
jgi:hypothetical protein